MKKEIKEELKENWGYDIISESPLKLQAKDEEGEIYETLCGLPAELFLIDVEKEMKEYENDGKFDISSLDDDDILLVKANVNYADEFDMEDFTTMTVETYKELVETLENHEDEIEWYFGTNEELSFSDGKDLLSCFSVEHITEEQSEVLDDLFGGSFGEAGVFDHCWDLGGEDEEYDDEEDEDEGPKSCLDKSEIRKIEKLKEYGWTITEDIGEYKFTYKHKDYEDSYTGASMIDDLIKYYRKNK